jgi:hypothetical protein
MTTRYILNLTLPTALVLVRALNKVNQWTYQLKELHRPVPSCEGENLIDFVKWA